MRPVRSQNRFEVLSEDARDGDAIDEAGEGVLVNDMLNWDRVREGVSEVLISDNDEEFVPQCSGQRRVMEFAEEMEREGNLPRRSPSSTSPSSSSSDSAGGEEVIFPRRRLRRGGARGTRVEIEPTVEEVRRAEAGLRPRQPPRPQAVPKQFCCVGAGCGQIFPDKVTLRHHFEIESVVCIPLLANHPRYHAYVRPVVV